MRLVTKPGYVQVDRIMSPEPAINLGERHTAQEDTMKEPRTYDDFKRIAETDPACSWILRRITLEIEHRDCLDALIDLEWAVRAAKARCREAGLQIK